MNWQSFLEHISQQEKITLVGPLYGRPHRTEEPTIYVDGGLLFHDPSGSGPSTSVGDGDSSPIPVDHSLRWDKDLSDLSYALRALPESIREVRLLGFLGGRRDHELLNLGEVHHFLKEKNHFCRVDFDQELIAFRDGALELEIHGRFSLIAFEPAHVTLTGKCRYPISSIERILPAVSSLGLSNEGSGSVRIQTIEPCFVWLERPAQMRTTGAIPSDPA